MAGNTSPSLIHFLITNQTNCLSIQKENPNNRRKFRFRNGIFQTFQSTGFEFRELK